MELKDIVAIAGRPGLYKVIARSPKGLIIESLGADKARMPVNANEQVSMLEDITIYTQNSEDGKPLKEVLGTMQEKAAELPIPDPKDASAQIIREYFKAIAPEHDEERVYISDLKKILKWYSILSIS